MSQRQPAVLAVTPRAARLTWRPSIFAAPLPGLQGLCVSCPSLREPCLWYTHKEHNPFASLCQDGLALLKDIDWNSVETLEVNFKKKERNKSRHNLKTKALNFCTKIWVSARLEGTTRKFFFGSLRILASSFLWLSSLQERHVAIAEPSINCSLPRRSHGVTSESTWLSLQKGCVWAEPTAMRLPHLSVGILNGSDWQLNLFSLLLEMGSSQSLHKQREKTQLRQC